MAEDFAEEKDRGILEILRMLRPHRIEGVSKIRLGRPFDGGYIMLNKLDGIEAAYSLGINDDVSWDLDIAARDIPVFQYDPTINSLPQRSNLFSWRKIGIKGRHEPGYGMTTISKIIRANKHSRSTNLIVKCDIERDEWEVFANLEPNVIAQFSQIVVEMHNFERITIKNFAELARAAVSNLTANHRVVHVHGNNYQPMVTVGNVTVPCILEVTLARVDQGKFLLSEEIFPTDIDMPCYPGVPDLYLGEFCY
jgi:hypothetical protein